MADVLFTMVNGVKQDAALHAAILSSGAVPEAFVGPEAVNVATKAGLTPTEVSLLYGRQTKTRRKK